MKKHGLQGKSGKPSQFFTNFNCEFYPCHKTDGNEFNCMFCYCPMYFAQCPSKPGFVPVGDALVKDCSGCDYPHQTGNYESIVQYLRDMTSVRDMTSGG